MLLEKVKINNFRNIESKEIDLNLVTVITGKNMTGKTNTLNAIHWAFTGVDMQGSNDNRANFPFGGTETISVELTFFNFTFKRECAFIDGTPTVSIYVDGNKAKTTKTGEALLHAKLGLTDIVLNSPKDFNIVRFLLDPLYFDTISPGALRKFFYMLSNTDFDLIASQQNKGVTQMLNARKIHDPYKLLEAIAKDKKASKKIIDACKVARDFFPTIKEEADTKEKAELKVFTKLEEEEALANKYALLVSKSVNHYYQRALGIKVCLIEKGVGEDVFKDVCYPILPNSLLPFSQGSQAEKTYVGMLFIREVCLKYNIKALPILVDNMESLDEKSQFNVDSLGVQYIGAKVQ